MQPLLSATTKPSEHNHLRTIMVNACMLSPKFRKKFPYKPDEVFCALIDTGVWGSATCHKELIHAYKKYTKSFPCPVKLTGVIIEVNGVSSSIVPEGEGYLRVPSRFPQHGYIEVKVFYSPHLAGTVINEEDYGTL